jgi:arylsulfatase
MLAAMLAGAAQAQTKKFPPKPAAQPVTQELAAPSGDRKPNILVIMGDDVG